MEKMKIVKLPIYRVLVPVSSVEEEFSKYREIGKRLKFESEIGVSELEIWDREFSRDLLSSRSQAFASIMIQACIGAKNMKTRIAQAAAPVRYSAAVEQVYNTKITCCEEVLPPCVVYLETSNCSLQPCAITKTYRSLSSSCVVAILLAVVGKKKKLTRPRWRILLRRNSFFSFLYSPFPVLEKRRKIVSIYPAPRNKVSFPCVTI